MIDLYFILFTLSFFLLFTLLIICRFKKDTIQKVCGILEVNCFEVITEEYSSIRGLYPKLAIMSHNCVANTTHSKILNEHK